MKKKQKQNKIKNGSRNLDEVREKIMPKKTKKIKMGY